MLSRTPKKTLSTILRSVITVQNKTSTSDGGGGFVVTWGNDVTIWANISPIKATQVAEYKSLNVEATHIVKVRGNLNSLIKEDYRIIYDSRVFEILTIENIQERGRMLFITCKELRD